MNLRALLLATISLPAFAEVSDKMATIPELWFQGIVGASILFILVRWSVWFVALSIIIVGFFLIASYETFDDPYVGVAILHEQGLPYVVSSYGSAVLMAAGAVLGFIINLRRKRHAT